MIARWLASRRRAAQSDPSATPSAELERRLEKLEQAIAQLAGELSTRDARLLDVLQLIYDEEPKMRRRLARVRQTEAYEAAYMETEPLVSIVIPTYDQHELPLDPVRAGADL
jgi:hypothetical protein